MARCSRGFSLPALKPGYLSGDLAEALAASEEAIRGARAIGLSRTRGSPTGRQWRESSWFSIGKAARQSAVLEERNQLAAEFHDALRQSFTGISMQLEVAEEQ